MHERNPQVQWKIQGAWRACVCAPRDAAERIGWESVVDRFGSVLRSVIGRQAACD